MGNIFETREQGHVGKVWCASYFKCPFSKNIPRVCSYSFPPFCIKRKLRLDEITSCNQDTLERLCDVDYAREFQTGKEVIREVQNALHRFKNPTPINRHDLYAQGGLNVLDEMEKNGELDEEDKELPEELKRELEKLTELKREHRREAGNKAAKTRKEKTRRTNKSQEEWI